MIPSSLVITPGADWAYIIAASLAELASAYPTAGALYHWASILGGTRAGFFTAWLNCIGQFAITAGIDYGLAQFVVALLGLPPERTLAVYAAVLLSHAVRTGRDRVGARGLLDDLTGRIEGEPFHHGSARVKRDKDWSTHATQNRFFRFPTV